MSQDRLKHNAIIPLLGQKHHCLFMLLSIGSLLICLTSVVMFPVWFSMISVLLLAGPHNWFEARYFLSRLPARWGKLRPFFLTSFCGVFLLTAYSIALTCSNYLMNLQHGTWISAYAIWLSCLFCWIMLLIHLRSQQNPRRDWSWIYPLGCACVLISWVMPLELSLLLVYIHPIMSFWLMDREVKRSCPAQLINYRAVLVFVPVCLVLIWLRHCSSQPLASDADRLFQQLATHAGADLLNNISANFLIACHTFLEMLHYFIWILGIPLLSFKGNLWELSESPLGKRSPEFRQLLHSVLLVSFIVVFILWFGFLMDYQTTRTLYFIVAIFHVLIEIPFLLRSL